MLKIKMIKAVYIDARGYFAGETYEVSKAVAEKITKVLGKDAYESLGKVTATKDADKTVETKDADKE